MSSLNGKIALVTGASRGIGAATAKALAREGAHVAVHYANSADEAQRVVGEIEAAGGRAFAVHADLTQTDGATRLAGTFLQALRERTGQDRFDILINNAGAAQFADLASTTEADYDRMFALNVRAPFFLAQKLAPHLNDHGRILFTSSAVTRIYFAGVPAYAATKGAVNTAVLYLAGELAARGITVNAVAPGVIETDMASFLATEEGRKGALSGQALKRIGQPDDVARLFVSLSGPAGGWTTGQVIDVSGGTILSQ